MEKLLRAILHRFAPQPADLEDLLQETFSRLFSLDSGRRAEVQNVQAFAITTARHVAMNWVRHRSVVSIETLEDLSTLNVADDKADLEEIVHTHQQLVRVASGIAGLPDRAREAFVLRRVYGLTQHEIATKMGVSEGAVEQLLVRGIKRCAQLMEEDERAKQKATRSGHVGLLERLRRRLRKTETLG